jgi:hypothetical protein
VSHSEETDHQKKAGFRKEAGFLNRGENLSHTYQVVVGTTLSISS